MGKEETELYELIRNLTKGLRKHGVKKVISVLKEINIVSENDKSFALIDFIENAVCEKLGVPMEELFNSTLRGEITIARKLCIVLIRDNIKNISNENLANHYNRSRQVVHTAEKEFELMKIEKNKNIQFHDDLLDIYNELDIEIKKFIKT